ncbi:16S rRNA (guanine(527)-N(7))-methyltransferase RsmG [Candidatus Margulisiibacteriota bacterium]
MKQEDIINRYIALLKEYNEKINIYSKKAYDKLSFHIQDSINIANLIKNKGKNIVDIGSGAGFPSVLISLINKHQTVYAVESKQKKCSFLNIVKEALSLENLNIINSDISSHLKEVNFSVDFFTAKAFASFDKILKILEKNYHSRINLIIPISYNQYLDYKKTSFLKFQIVTCDKAEYYYLLFSE